jgi:hypothetical protein
MIILRLRVPISLLAMGERKREKQHNILECPGRTMVEHSTHNLKVKGSYPATSTGKEIIAKSDNAL